ncbi:MAG: rhodanese-like domain-containing protein, partial [Desulfobacterales bacterium]
MKQAIVLLTVFTVFFSMPAAVVTAQEAGGLFISPEYAAVQIKSSQKIQFVDVRRKEEFDKIRIPGSIHVPAHFLKTKAYLKNKKIVLVNKGFSKRPLISACKDLNNRGFDARILSGGINAWVGKGLPVMGSTFAKNSLTMVSPRRAFQEHSTRSFLPVDISDSKASEVFDNTVYVTSSSKE